jgi:hypothetical protein
MNRDKKLKVIYRLQDIFACIIVLFFGAFAFNLIYWYIYPFNDPFLVFVPFILSMLSLLVFLTLKIWEDKLW